jgi:glycosyltransferase involved in cell wall biosynthesis
MENIVTKPSNEANAINEMMGYFPLSVAVIIPCYRVQNYILKVITDIGPEVKKIYVVDDACPEKSGQYVKENCSDDRLEVIFNERNLGVGGAMIAGYKKALVDKIDVVVKVDGDGQMDPKFIPVLIRPIVKGRADYTKGNRFFRLDGVSPMPTVRIFGNAVLSFMAKLSTGYWNVFDPTNGYTAIHSKVLAELPLDKISKRYFFETDMLFRLNTLRAVVVDVPMRAIYCGEPSNLKISRVIPEFLWNHFINLNKRVFYNYLLRNFSAFSIELFLGIMLLMGGAGFGLFAWYHFATRNIPATAGIVMFAALPVIAGIQLILSFLNWDAQNVPVDPMQHRL